MDEHIKDRVTGYDFEVDEPEAFEVSGRHSGPALPAHGGAFWRPSCGDASAWPSSGKCITALGELSRLCEGTSANVCNMVLSMLSDAAQEWREQYEEAR